MKINWQYDISLKWLRIPLIPYISLTEVQTEVQPVVVVQTIPAPEAEILPIPAPPAKPTGKGTEHTKEREYDPNKRYRRGTGMMAGTEAYRAIHVQRDLIRWFMERSNKPLSFMQLRTMKKSPFIHAWAKCEVNCTHKVANDATLRRVLRNDRTHQEKQNETPKVITFVKRKKGYNLSTDLYKSLLEENSLLNQWQPPTPQVQLPEETSTVANWVKENSEMRR